MTLPLWMFVFFLVSYVNGHAVKGSKKPLFAEDHVNITYLTDVNFDSLVTKSGTPWLVDYYHPL